MNLTLSLISIWCLILSYASCSLPCSQISSSNNIAYSPLLSSDIDGKADEVPNLTPSEPVKSNPRIKMKKLNRSRRRIYSANPIYNTNSLMPRSTISSRLTDLFTCIIHSIVNLRGYSRHEHLNNLKYPCRNYNYEKSLEALKTSQVFLPADYNNILIAGIKNYNEAIIHVIRRYQWEQINFNDLVWKDQELLEACYDNGYDDIADFLKTIHDFDSVEPDTTTISSFCNALSFKRPEIRDLKTIDLYESERLVINSKKMLKRKERYKLFYRLEDYKYKSGSILSKYRNDGNILIDAILKNDRELVYLLSKYGNIKLDSEDDVWLNTKLIASIRDNGYDEIIAKIRYNSKEK